MNFKKRFKKILLWSTAIFIVMFLFRFSYGYFKYPNGNNDSLTGLTNTTWSRGASFNIASSKYKYKNSSSKSQMVQVDQKFEKTANLECKSENFEENEKEIRDITTAKNAIIQFQQKSGNEGNRQLHLQIGVPPEMFDSFIDEIKKSQNVVSISMTKKDKTNEYRELNSKLKTLTNTRNSLIELKQKGGKIEEFVQLENRILEIDEQLQGLGVQLGNFDSENEFCTINISLLEGKVNKIGLMQRFKVALEWTIEYYLMLMFAFVLASISAFAIVQTIDRLNILSKFK